MIVLTCTACNFRTHADTRTANDRFATHQRIHGCYGWSSIQR